MLKRNRETKKEAAAFGIIGIPDEESIRMLKKMLEKEWRKPVKRMEKKGRIILSAGRGLFKRKVVIPMEE